MKKNTITIILLATVLSFGSVFADGKGKGKRGDHSPDAATVFAAIDTNGDGEISREELAASKKFKDADKKEVEAALKEKDLNGDGKISEREFSKTFGEAHGGKRGKGKGKGKGGKGGKGGDAGKGDGKGE